MFQKKQRKNYSNTKVKYRDLIRNVSCRRYNPEDVEKVNFVVDVFSFLTQNLNLTGLDKKRKTALERDYVKMIWDTSVPHKFSKFIYLKEKFIDLLSTAHNLSKSN